MNHVDNYHIFKMDNYHAFKTSLNPISLYYLWEQSDEYEYSLYSPVKKVIAKDKYLLYCISNGLYDLLVLPFKLSCLWVMKLFAIDVNIFVREWHNWRQAHFETDCCNYHYACWRG